MCQEVLQPMGDPPWSRDTPKGLQHVEDLGWRRGEQAKRKEQRKKTVRNKKQQQDDITYQTQSPELPVASPKGFAGRECNGCPKQEKGRVAGVGWGNMCWTAVKPGELGRRRFT